jgi:hypothetical protein
MVTKKFLDPLEITNYDIPCSIVDTRTKNKIPKVSGKLHDSTASNLNSYIIRGIQTKLRQSIGSAHQNDHQRVLKASDTMKRLEGHDISTSKMNKTEKLRRSGYKCQKSESMQPMAHQRRPCIRKALEHASNT